jgi:hypothetical protein
MNTLSHKAAVASICTALGFVLGANHEAKAASLIFTPTIKFTIVDGGGLGAIFDGLGDRIYPEFGSVLRGTEGESSSLAEFNIGSFSLAPNKFISSAVFQTVTNPYIFVHGFGVEVGIRPRRLGLFGYVGNGIGEVSDFEAGVFLSSVDVSSSSQRAIILNFDVTSFVNQRVSNGNAFAGFGIRALDFGGLGVMEQDYDIPLTKLIIETPNVVEPVPEPTTIFGSAIGLCLGGWLKRKKSSQQNKKAPQR